MRACGCVGVDEKYLSSRRGKPIRILSPPSPPPPPRHHTPLKESQVAQITFSGEEENQRRYENPLEVTMRVQELKSPIRRDPVKRRMRAEYGVTSFAYRAVIRANER